MNVQCPGDPAWAPRSFLGHRALAGLDIGDCSRFSVGRAPPPSPLNRSPRVPQGARGVAEPPSWASGPPSHSLAASRPRATCMGSDPHVGTSCDTPLPIEAKYRLNCGAATPAEVGGASAPPAVRNWRTRRSVILARHWRRRCRGVSPQALHRRLSVHERRPRPAGGGSGAGLRDPGPTSPDPDDRLDCARTVPVPVAHRIAHTRVRST